MKTTLNLPDDLLREAKELAARDGITLKEFVESSLRKEVEQRSAPRRFYLADVSWGEKGFVKPKRSSS